MGQERVFMFLEKRDFEFIFLEKRDLGCLEKRDLGFIFLEKRDLEFIILEKRDLSCLEKRDLGFIFLEKRDFILFTLRIQYHSFIPIITKSDRNLRKFFSSYAGLHSLS